MTRRRIGKKNEPPADGKINHTPVAVKVTESGQSLIQTPAWACILVVAVALLLYANTIGFKYVYDDGPVIAENRLVRQGVKAIPQILITPYWRGYWQAKQDMYRPLSMVMFAIEWQVSPGKPWFSHLLNVLLYAVTGLILLIIISGWLKDEPGGLWLGLSATLLFVTHPLHTEVVANIKSRDEILALLMGLLAIHFQTRAGVTSKRFPLFLSFGFYFLALLAKESSVAWLAICPLTWYFFGRISWGKMACWWTILLAVTIGYFVIRWRVLGQFFPEQNLMTQVDNCLVAAPTLWHRWATAILVLGKYLILLVWPVNLSWDYSYPSVPLVSIRSPMAWLPLMIYLGLFFLALRGWRSRKIWSFAILFYLFSLAPVSNLFTLNVATMAERFLYTPSLGYALGLAWAVARIQNLSSLPESGFRETIRQKKYYFLPLAIILVFFSWRTVSRNPVWRDNWTLFNRGSSNSRSSRIHYNLGCEAFKQYIDAGGVASLGKQSPLLDTAIRELKRALQLNPSDANAVLSLGNAYKSVGNIQESIKYYQQALDLDPGKPDTYTSIGVLYAQIGDLTSATLHLRKAIELDPSNRLANFNLAAVYINMGKIDLARHYLKQILNFWPDDPLAWEQLQQLESAKKND